MNDLDWLEFCIDEAQRFGHDEKAAGLSVVRDRLISAEDALKQWSFAERSKDEVEMQNARRSRDRALSRS